MRPNPLFILPDDSIAGRVVVESVTSEAGPYAGPVTLGASNDGDLLPNTYAHEVTADYAIDLGLVRAGGPYRTAEWKWKTQAEGSTAWKGADQVNWASNTHDPFAGAPLPREALSCMFAKRLNTIFLYWVTNFNEITVAYRAAGGDPTSWTTTTISMSTRPIVGISAGAISVFELPDGALRMLVVVGSSAVANNDVDVYSSTDGLSWTLASRNVISQAGVGLLLIQNFRAACSGDWIRLIVMTAGTTYSLVSSDRGASFGQLTNFTIPIPSNGEAANPYSAVDLVGLDDYAGTFVLFFNDGSTLARLVEIGLASRDEDFAAIGVSITSIDHDVMRICAVKTPTHILALIVEWDGTAADARYFGAISCERNLAASSDSVNWKPFLMGVGYNTAKYLARSVCSCEVDGGSLIMFGLENPDAGGVSVDGGGVFYLQQWTARAAWADEVISATATEPHSAWEATLSDVNTWASSPWTTTTGASATRMWSIDHTQIASSAAGVGGIAKSVLAPGAATRWADGNNMLAEWIVRQPTPGAAGSDDRTAVRIQGIGTTAGISIDFSVRHLGTEAVLFDNGTSLPLATLSLSLASYFYVGRACVTQHNSATWAEMAFARVDQMGSAWSVASGTLHTAVIGIAAQTISWGHLTGVAAVSSDWRRFVFSNGSSWHQAGFVNPTSLRGAPVSARSWYTTAGVWTDWSGGAGFEFDTWLGESRHRNEVDNLFLPSPQATWRSTSLASNQIVLDAENVSRPVFAHDGASFYGCNVRKLRIAYNAANSWAAPATEHTLYSDLVAGLTVSAVGSDLNAGYVDVSGSTLDAGAYAGKWLHATNGPWSGASITISAQVGNRLFFGHPGWTSNPMATGNSVVIHGSVLATLFAARAQYRYMLLEASGQTTAAGYYEIGTPVCGVTFGLDGAAVEWAHAEATINGVEVTDGIGGVAWAYEATQPRRSWEGRIAGDASKVRRTFERVLRSFADLSVRPFTMLWDRDDLPATAAPVRYVGDVAFANDGWRQAADGTWYPVGDADVQFREEL
mgnify:FL=1